MGRGERLVVVSNRLPPLDAPTTDEERRSAPVGGLVSALRAALEEREGLWFGWSGRVAERGEEARPAFSTSGRIQMAAIDLTRNEASLFYNEFCNRTLWPLLHGFPAKVSIRHDAYRAFLRANQRYAETLVPMLRDGDRVWVNDFHLLPLGYELRRLGWQGKIGFFLHTPFPPAEVFAVLPWAHRLLSMLLDYDLLGLHTRRYVNNLRDSMANELAAVVIGEELHWERRSVPVNAYPIGIDADRFGEMAAREGETRIGRSLRQVSPRHQVVLGVDRLDYTKGIVRRLQTFEHLLDHYPAHRGRVSLIQISAPSRSRVPEYVDERQQVDRLVGAINGRFSDGEWVPIRYLYRSYPEARLTAFYREAHVGLVTPLRDGMNLVAKEFVASQGSDPGILVLSKFCGAAETMQDALLVNPYDIEGTAQAVSRALRMPGRERLRRWKALIQDVRSSTAQVWSDSFLADLASR